jgi:hypothetical protein
LGGRWPRPFLNALRTATLRHDEECQVSPAPLSGMRPERPPSRADCQAVWGGGTPQVTLLNELLRNYLAANLYAQAEKLAAKTTLPEAVGNHQHARYTYYLGTALVPALAQKASERARESVYVCVCVWCVCVCVCVCVYVCVCVCACMSRYGAGPRCSWPPAWLGSLCARLCGHQGGSRPSSSTTRTRCSTCSRQSARRRRPRPRPASSRRCDTRAVRGEYAPRARPLTHVFLCSQVHKLMVIVQLLLGEIPERALFRQPVLRRPLLPYLRLAQSMRAAEGRGASPPPSLRLTHAWGSVGRRADRRRAAVPRGGKCTQCPVHR